MAASAQLVSSQGETNGNSDWDTMLVSVVASLFAGFCGSGIRIVATWIEDYAD
jgi:hypothetical protein